MYLNKIEALYGILYENVKLSKAQLSRLRATFHTLQYL